MVTSVRSVRAFLLAASCVMLVAANAPPASAATKGFTIDNLTGATLKLSSVTTHGRQPVFEEPTSESAPPLPENGDLIYPGEVRHIELYDQFSNTSEQKYRREARLSFAEFPPPKPGGPDRTFHVSLVTGDRYGPANQVVVGCHFGRPSQCLVNGTKVELLDPPGTHVTIPATAAEAQGAVLTDVCTKEVKAVGGTCAFDPRKLESTTVPNEPVSEPVINCTHKEIEVTEKAEHKVGTTNSVEVGSEFEIQTGLAENHVKLAVETKYGHEWIDEHKFEKEIPVPIEPGHKGWVEHAAPVIRVTGNFTMTIGNTTFTLNGVYFDHPDPSRQGSFYAQAVKTTATEQSNCKGGEKLARVPRSDLTVTRSATARSDILRGGAEPEVFRGLSGNDIMGGGSASETVFGGPGNDLLVGSAGPAVINAGSGADMIVDTVGPAVVHTGSGWDFVYVRDGRGDDTVICNSQRTYVVADAGDRVLGHCGVVSRRGSIDHPLLPVGWSSG